MMESAIKEQVIQSVEAIKDKIKRMKNEESENEIKFSKIFKPITDPLKTMDLSLSKLNTQKNSEFDQTDSFKTGNESVYLDHNKDSNYDQEYDDNIQSSIFTPEIKVGRFSTPKSNIDSDKSKKFNIPFGIRKENEKLLIGNSEIQFCKIGALDDQYTLATISDKKYELTPGLKEILFNEKPNLEKITDMDKVVYKDILVNTSAHKRDYSPQGQIKGSKSMKYNKLVRPLFFDFDGDKPKDTKKGGTLPKLKTLKKNTDYVYWDDPNELIERLQLLIASKEAGNNSHDNEIISIIEELKEANIIKE